MIWSLIPKKPRISDVKMSPAAVNGTSNLSYIGAIDQGTTSSRFLIFSPSGDVIATHQLEFKQYYPQPG